MNLRVPLGAAIAFALVVAALTFSITLQYARSDYNERAIFLREREAANGKFAEVDREVRQRFFGTINETHLMDSVVRGYLIGLGDPNAVYWSAEENARRNQTIVGEAVGIGAALEIHPNGYFLVREVFPESPAQAGGIEAGDWIVNMDDTALTPENVEAQYLLIYDAVGTRVTLTVRREGEDFIVDITRREVERPTVYASVIADTEVGHIIITEFDDRTSIQFNRELSRIQDLGVQAIIFDVRDNPGGNLRQAARVIDRLIPAGPIVSAVFRDGSVQVLETADTNRIENMSIVVLTNRNTAAAAELFALAMRDSAAGRIVGTSTAGEGAMLDDINLSDGSAISITVALYRSPSGETWNETGVSTDFEVAMPGELESVWRELDHTTDPQLAKAVEVALGIQVVEISDDE